MVKIPSEALSDYLKRPRSAKEIASRFGISERLALSHLKEGITTGRISVIGPPLRLRGSEGHPEWKQIPKTLQVPRNTELIGIAGSQIAGSRRLRLSMQRAKNRLITSPHSNPQSSLKVTRKRRLLGASDLLHILSHVKDHPATIAETREALAISGVELKRLLRTGLLKESWGRGGVGVTIRLSGEGFRQLSWMKEASRLDPRAKRALFVGLKQNYVPL